MTDRKLVVVIAFIFLESGHEYADHFGQNTGRDQGIVELPCVVRVYSPGGNDSRTYVLTRIRVVGLSNPSV